MGDFRHGNLCDCWNQPNERPKPNETFKFHQVGHLLILRLGNGAHLQKNAPNLAGKNLKNCLTNGLVAMYITKLD